MTMIKLMDCTLRDGGNVVGKGFNAALTELMLEGLTACRVPIIELGNAGGIGAYEVAGFTEAETDQTYLDIARKYMGRGSDLGMFLNAKRYREESVALAKESGLDFLRIGTDAGDADVAIPAIQSVKAAGLQAYYSLMKAYLLTPAQLAEEGKRLEAAGLDQITIMDSAGTMLPDEVAEYVEMMKRAVRIPVGFHCHNNMGMSAANAVAAARSGADILDCGLMGMARSAGNLATEMCVAVMQRLGMMEDIDLYGMLDFIDRRLQPAMDAYQYHNPVPLLDLVLGLSGCHSSFVKKFKAVAAEKGVSLYRLIVESSAIDRKSPSDELVARMADRIKEAAV